jgi:hypothetical protein
VSLGVAAALIAGCGGGSGGSADSSGTSGTNPPPQTGKLSLMMSDASTEDWATIGVKVLSIALVPQGGGDNVTVYTASPAPMINLVELDQISEILGNVTVPVGTYTGAVLTVSGNPSDILLTVANDPEAGFAAAPGSTIPSSQIQVQHTQGSSGNLTVPVKVAFVSPLVVSAGGSNALDLEFDLAHPAFLIGHVPPTGGGNTIWAVNFEGPVRHHPIRALDRLVLRHTYGNVMSISSDSSSISITKDYPVEPPTNPETAVAGSQSLTIEADATNGTLLYDVDAQTHTTITSFAAEGDIVGKYVRVAARYQEDGTLVATRIWVSSSFNSVWLSPEGHVLHVNTGTNVVIVENELGAGVPLTVNADTQFYYRQPQNGAADSTPIGSGPAFLAAHDLVRGFKVHASVVDPLASPLVAQSIDIETAGYAGAISAPNSTGFTYTRDFRTMSDDYVVTLDYISSSTPNGTDAMGNAIDGYKYWNFAYPTLYTSGSNVIPDFMAATDGSVNFGGLVGTVPSRGVSYAVWNDPAAPNAWAAADTVLMPSLVPLSLVAGGFANNAFTITAIGGSASMPVTVDVSITSGSATLVYQIDRTNGIVTVSPIDITTNAGLMALENGLTVGAPVAVFGVPQANATLTAYVIAYYTGEMPATNAPAQ